MEHIEGETLADRLRKGAVLLDLALRYGVRSWTLVPSHGRSSSARASTGSTNTWDPSPSERGDRGYRSEAPLSLTYRATSSWVANQTPGRERMYWTSFSSIAIRERCPMM